MRLIDADALMPNAEYKGRYDVVTAYDIANAPTIEPEPQWVPCSEKLPKKEERSYWICLDSGGQCQCRWTNDMYGLGANEHSKWGWHIMDKPQYSKVTAWMPLPKPWKGEEK